VRQRQFGPAEAVLRTGLLPNQPLETLAQQWAELVHGELALANGDASLVLDIVDQLSAVVPQRAASVAPLLAQLHGSGLALQGHWAEAEAHFRAAVAELRARGAHATLWHVHLRLGQLYKQSDRRKHSERAFGAARVALDAIAEQITDGALRAAFVQRANALIPAAPVLTPRKAAKHAAGGLTERERDVVVLIAGGNSNRQIAATLRIGAKTVEAHISRILSKLGYTSRAQIAAWAVDKGLAPAPPELGADA
jgi:DNA-binding CsgD family transcriptional regulator